MLLTKEHILHSLCVDANGPIHVKVPLQLAEQMKAPPEVLARIAARVTWHEGDVGPSADISGARDEPEASAPAAGS